MNNTSQIEELKKAIKEKNYEVVFSNLEPVWKTYIARFDRKNFDDLLQEARIKIWQVLLRKGKKKVDLNKNFRSFLLTAGINCIIDNARKLKRLNKDSTENFEIIIERIHKNNNKYGYGNETETGENE